MGDSADCYAATVALPDGLGPRDKLAVDTSPSHRSASSAQTNDHSLVIGALELANSVSSRLGAISGQDGSDN
jgi:hypothetical protein